MRKKTGTREESETERARKRVRLKGDIEGREGGDRREMREGRGRAKRERGREGERGER